MENQQRPLAKEIEALLKKAAEANTVIVSETSKFLSRLSKSEIKPGEMASLRNKLFTDAISGLIKLNVQYTSNLIDMGVAISKSINQRFSPADSSTAESVSTTTEPAPAKAFELKTVAEAGGQAATAFLLNSDKAEPIKCTIIHSDFISEEDAKTVLLVEIAFTPQAFELIHGQAQRIDALIKTKQDAAPGAYRSHVTIHGFEHTHFDIVLQVLPAKAIEEVSTQAAAPPQKAKPSANKPAGKGKRQTKNSTA